MLSKEQIRLFEKKGGKKEDYNLEEIVSDNKKYYISTDADNKVFIVEENDYEDFLQKKREINKKRNEEIKQIKKRDCIRKFMYMLNKLSLKKLQNKWFSEGISLEEMKNAAKEEISENWTNPYEFMYYPKTLSKDDMLDKDSICIMLKHNSKEDLIPFSIEELYVFNKLKNNEVFYTSDFEETFNPFEKSYCKEYIYRNIKSLSFEEKKEKIFSLSKDVWSEGFVVYLYNTGIISKKSKFNNYDPKNDAIFLINAISTGFENLEEKQKKRVHAIAFEIVKDL